MHVIADFNKVTGQYIHKVPGKIISKDNSLEIEWDDFRSSKKPKIHSKGYYFDYVGATLTAKAFDAVNVGLGKWLITIASWFFAISTIMAWGYYGEQGLIYLFGEKSVFAYRITYCSLIFITCTTISATNIEEEGRELSII